MNKIFILVSIVFLMSVWLFDLEVELALFASSADLPLQAHPIRRIFVQIADLDLGFEIYFIISLCIEPNFDCRFCDIKIIGAWIEPSIERN